jgi:hypothetical protein
MAKAHQRHVRRGRCPRALVEALVVDGGTLMGLSEEMAEGLMAAADSHRIRQQYRTLFWTFVT